MKKLSFIVSLLLITNNVYAEWVLYGGTPDGNVMFYDKSNIKRNGDIVRVWTYLNFSQNNKGAKALNIASSRMLEEIDCVNQTNKRLAFDTYTKLDLTGHLGDNPPPYPKISYIVPNSAYAALMNLVCKK